MEVGHGAGDSKKEAEQRAAFSVSQYMSDEQCASLLDKVDRLEGAVHEKIFPVLFCARPADGDSDPVSNTLRRRLYRLAGMKTV